MSKHVKKYRCKTKWTHGPRCRYDTRLICGVHRGHNCASCQGIPQPYGIAAVRMLGHG